MKSEQHFGSISKVNLRILEIFSMVAREGSMSSAAALLGMSPAAVSQAISTLETTMQLTLFDRSVRPAPLTLAGATVQRIAEEAIEKLRELEGVTRTGAAAKIQLLRFGMQDSFTSTAGVAMFRQIRDLAFNWTVTSGVRNTNYPALTERRSDVVLTSDESPVPSGVKIAEILTETYLLAVPSGHRGKLRDLKRLSQDLDFIRYGRDSNLARKIESFVSRHALAGRSAYQFDTSDAALRMVAGGFGWTIVTPLIYLKSMVPADSVQLLSLPSEPLVRRLVVAMRENECKGILESVRLAATQALRTVVLPQLKRQVPRVLENFLIAAD